MVVNRQLTIASGSSPLRSISSRISSSVAATIASASLASACVAPRTAKSRCRGASSSPLEAHACIFPEPRPVTNPSGGESFALRLMPPWRAKGTPERGHWSCRGWRQSQHGVVVAPPTARRSALAERDRARESRPAICIASSAASTRSGTRRSASGDGCGRPRWPAVRAQSSPTAAPRRFWACWTGPGGDRRNRAAASGGARSTASRVTTCARCRREETGTVDGIPCTSPARTLVDLGGMVGDAVAAQRLRAGGGEEDAGHRRDRGGARVRRATRGA